mgnify:FL=1
MVRVAKVGVPCSSCHIHMSKMMVINVSVLQLGARDRSIVYSWRFVVVLVIDMLLASTSHFSQVSLTD